MGHYNKVFRRISIRMTVTKCSRMKGAVMGKVYGYVRVSSREQNESRQVIAMHEMRISDTNIFIDKQSGKDFDRPQYKRLLKRIKETPIKYIHLADFADVTNITRLYKTSRPS